MGKIYLLIWVHRGMIQEPEIFLTRKSAELREKNIRRNGFNPDYDELEIFEGKI
jgi:hypothetical protein